MKLIAQVQLNPTDSQRDALRKTLRQANAACNHIAAWAWEHQVFRHYVLHQALYYDLRAQFGLPAQLAVRCLAKVGDAYKLDRKSQRTFQPFGGIAYDDRLLSWHVDKGEVSIGTLHGRERVPFVCGPRQRELLASRQGESDLVYVDGRFYLLATCNAIDPEPRDVEDYLGVDLGIVNLATDSDGEVHSGKTVNGLRHRHVRLRARLQSKRTKSAKQLLKRRRRKEARFARDVNHCISKTLVAKAEGTGRGIALENLKGIRERLTVRKAQRRIQHSWAFHQLQTFVAYKARRVGLPVVLVDPRNTSRTCPSCGLVDKANRPSQALFRCIQCGFSGHADTIAAENIRRAAVNRPYVEAA